MALTEYRAVRNGKIYEYKYDRSNYKNNTTEYNKNYWEDNKEKLKKKAKLRRIEKHLSKIPKSTGTEIVIKKEIRAMEQQPFYMLKRGRIDNKNDPTIVFNTYEDVEREATRLAQKHIGESMFILKSVCVVKTKEPEVSIVQMY